MIVGFGLAYDTNKINDIDKISCYLLKIYELIINYFGN